MDQLMNSELIKINICLRFILTIIAIPLQEDKLYLQGNFKFTLIYPL